jgi:hypothetical protein
VLRRRERMARRASRPRRGLRRAEGDLRRARRLRPGPYDRGWTGSHGSRERRPGPRRRMGPRPPSGESRRPKTRCACSMLLGQFRRPREESGLTSPDGRINLSVEHKRHGSPGTSTSSTTPRARGWRCSRSVSGSCICSSSRNRPRRWRKAIDMPRQRVLYHLRTLEAQRLVEAQDHGTVGRRIDRTYVRTATSYAIAPKTTGRRRRRSAHGRRRLFFGLPVGRGGACAERSRARSVEAAAARGKRVPTHRRSKPPCALRPRRSAAVRRRTHHGTGGTGRQVPPARRDARAHVPGLSRAATRPVPARAAERNAAARPAGRRRDRRPQDAPPAASI